MEKKTQNGQKAKRKMIKKHNDKNIKNTFGRNVFVIPDICKRVSLK